MKGSSKERTVKFLTIKKGRCIFKRETKYYEWKKPGSLKDDHRIPIQYDLPENRHMTPWEERVFPNHKDLIEIDAERYILLIKSWGRKLYKELKKVPPHRQCGWCKEEGYPIVYMGDGALYCGSCMDDEK